jgi:hypothetical protein
MRETPSEAAGSLDQQSLAQAVLISFVAPTALNMNHVQKRKDPEVIKISLKDVFI